MQSDVCPEYIDEVLLLFRGAVPCGLSTEQDAVAHVVDVVVVFASFHSMAYMFGVFKFADRAAFPACV